MKSLILRIIFLTFSNSDFVAQSNARICSSAISGSLNLSSLRQYSNRGCFRTVPSSIPNLLVIEPVATLRTINSIGIKHHLVKRLNMREQVVKLVEIIPIEFIVRNVATGSLTKRLE